MINIKKAVEKYSSRQITNKTGRKNKKPEAKLVLELKDLLNGMGWSIDIVESKAVYSPSAGRYLRGQTVAGMSDLVGNTAEGVAAFIEVKAKDRRNTLRPVQHEFLRKKIETGCFAIVCDEIPYLFEMYNGWKRAENKKEFLLNNLPNVPKRFLR